MPDSVRLFVAIWLPGDARAELAAAVERVRASTPAGLRWTPYEQWHLTMCFLGEVDVGAVPKVEAELAHVARRHQPVRVRIAGAGRFGDRVLWAGLAEPDAPPGRTGPGLAGLRAIAGATARRCAKAGVAADDKPFKAHLTLARARDRAELRPLADALRPFEGTPWSATHLCLVRSRLGAGPTAARRTTTSAPGRWAVRTGRASNLPRCATPGR